VPEADELLRLSAAFAVQPTEPAVTTAVTFDATASTPVPGNSVDEYEWTLGDGTTATGETVSHSYDDPGEYTVELMITSGDERGRRHKSLVVQPELTAALGVSVESPTTTDVVRFDAGETVPGDSIDQYKWTLGDGTTATGEPSHTATTTPASIQSSSPSRAVTTRRS
jgi:PKD domain.